jgi:hypothetical protein
MKLVDAATLDSDSGKSQLQITAAPEYRGAGAYPISC